MTGKNRFLRPAAARAVENLTAGDGPDGRIPYRALAREAAAAGYSSRHVRRLLDKQRRGEPLWKAPAFEVTEQVVTAVFLTCGSLAAAHRLLQRHGVAVPSVSTFKRHVVAELGTDQLAYAAGGSVAFRDTQAYLRADYPHRGHTVLLDHTELPIWVVPTGYKAATKPWMTAVMDAKTRYVLSWVITWGRPTAAEVRAALMGAMTTRLAPDGATVVGGRPMRALWDRGLEFLSNLVTESCLRLDVLPVALPAYSPHLKGRLERFWRFIQADCLAVLPGYNAGPVDLRGERAIATAALGEDEFLVRIADWVDWYLTEHRTEGRVTPLEAWKSDATPLQEVTPEQLWIDMLVAKKRCKVSKNGIRFNKIDWIAPELTGVVGRTVEVRYLPHDHTFIEVFVDSDHLCSAHPQGTLSPDEEQAVIQQRRERRLQARSRFSTANRQRRAAHRDVNRITKDKVGNRVVAATDDLLTGGDTALCEVVGPAVGDQSRLF